MFLLFVAGRAIYLVHRRWSLQHGTIPPALPDGRSANWHFKSVSFCHCGQFTLSLVYTSADSEKLKILYH